MRSVLLVGLLCCCVALMAQGFAPTPPVAKPIEARVPWYTVKPDLSNVSNRKMLPALTPAQRSALTRYGFVARPTAEEQLFYVYENNAYKKIGSFVTTDSVLHTYHIFYDFSLRNLEKTRLLPAVRDVSARMLKANLTALAEKLTPFVREALRKNVVFFAVPLTLLGTRPDIPADLRPLLDGEISRIMAHQGRAGCITGAELDYSQFIPRGHYTREKLFEQYFRAMMWYGLVPMPLEKEYALDIPPTLQALIITEQLQQDSTARALWQQVYDPTVFYVGSADDLSFYDYGKLIPPVFGQGLLDRFADPAKLAKFYDAAKKELRGPGIENYTGGEGLQGKQFRFMGQRFIPDSRILQELTTPKVGERYFPMGLDVFAVLGNAHAAQLLDETYRQTQYANYLSQRKKLQDEIAALTPAEWMQNLYYGWMYCLLPLQQPRPEGYPAFMRNVAWQEKSLLTSLGSWTELRHDTILYAKQSVAECGEGGDAPPPVMGYVEPEVLVYERLGQLLRLNKAGLLQRHLLTSEDELAYDFDAFIELTDFLATASRKELRNEALSRDELRALEHYGGTLERLMLSIASLGNKGTPNNWWEIESKTDRSMALIADVHTSMPNVLEEGVGNAAEMWVVVPVQGKLYLTRGAIFTYYEFQHPASDRMTDEAWQARVRKGTTPPMPGWVHRFLLGPGPQKPSAPAELQGEDTGC